MFTLGPIHGAGAPIPAARAGLNGIHKATDGMNQAAQNIVSKSFGEVDSNTLIDDFVALKKNQLLFEASGKVVKASTDSAGRLIDILV